LPYYREYSAFDPYRAGHVLTPLRGGAPADDHSTYFRKYSNLLTWRTNGPKGNVSNAEVSEVYADPYAYFLNSARDRKLAAALKSRGFDPAPMPPDTGHPFSLTKWEVFGSDAATFTDGDYWRWNSTNPAFLGFPALPSSSAYTFAHQSWGKLAPKSEMFDVAQFVGELREGLPSMTSNLLKGKVNFFKDLGADYLNVEFGWKPFINDIINAVSALGSATTMLSRPFGPIHRSREVVDEVVIADSSGSGVISYPPYPPDSSYIPLTEFWKVQPNTHRMGSGWQNWGNLSRSTGTYKKTWFEGNFFLLPKLGFNPEDYMSRLDSLVNTKLTPSILYELSPWSWLIDWGAKIGDSLQTAEALADDRVHAQYAYGMQETMAISTITRVSPYYWSPSQVDPKGSISTRTTRKERVRANPYGFTVGGASSLNSWQQSILLALGLTKAL